MFRTLHTTRHNLSLHLPVLCLLFIQFFLATNICGQASQLRFERYLPEQGLSYSTVTSIIQDSRGFMWFGTFLGLNRFDGYEFKVYLPEPGNPNSLSDAQVWGLCEDQEGNIWIATTNGLNKFDFEKEKFTKYDIDRGIRQKM